MPHITRPEVLINRATGLQMRIPRQEFVPQQAKELIEAGPGREGDIIDLVSGLRRLHGGGEQVSLDDVGDVTEVPAGLPVAVDADGFVPHHGRNPFRDHSRIRSIGVLTRTEYIEIPEADGGEPITTAKDLRIKLVGPFGHRIGRKALTERILNLWEGRVVAVNRAARGVHEPFYPAVAGCDQYI